MQQIQKQHLAFGPIFFLRVCISCRWGKTTVSVRTGLGRLPAAAPPARGVASPSAFANWTLQTS
jgi:hypothetical protein